MKFAISTVQNPQLHTFFYVQLEMADLLTSSKTVRGRPNMVDKTIIPMWKMAKMVPAHSPGVVLLGPARSRFGRENQLDSW